MKIINLKTYQSPQMIVIATTCQNLLAGSYQSVIDDNGEPSQPAKSQEIELLEVLL